MLPEYPGLVRTLYLFLAPQSDQPIESGMAYQSCTHETQLAPYLILYVQHQRPTLKCRQNNIHPLHVFSIPVVGLIFQWNVPQKQYHHGYLRKLHLRRYARLKLWLFCALLSKKRYQSTSNLLICMVYDNFT